MIDVFDICAFVAFAVLLAAALVIVVLLGTDLSQGGSQFMPPGDSPGTWQSGELADKTCTSAC
jgi:hypothetical protein